MYLNLISFLSFIIFTFTLNWNYSNYGVINPVYWFFVLLLAFPNFNILYVVVCFNNMNFISLKFLHLYHYLNLGSCNRLVLSYPISLMAT